MILIYNLITLLLLPIYVIMLIWRLFKGKEDFDRILERFGISQQKRPEGQIFWLHAASVGESNIIINLIQNISFTKNCTYLVTSGTITSAQILNSKLPASAIHQFLPYDNFLFIRFFLKKWQPYIGLFIEAEIWPALINESAKTCKLLLINAHMSNKSFGKWQLAKKFFQQTMAHFSEILTQSIHDFEKYKSFNLKNLTNIGNIKFSNKKLDVDDLELQKFDQLFENRIVVFLASTHLEDEQNILGTIKSIRYILPKSYFIIAPRHPERREEIAKQCDFHGVTYSFRSKSVSATLSDDLYIVDNFGDLGLFYSLAYISFVGGSFASGGHNPLEPAHFANFILLGPDMSNYQNITNDMLTAKAALQFQTKDDFFDLLQYYLIDKNNVDTLIYRNNSLNFIKEHQHISDKYLNIIKKYA